MPIAFMTDPVTGRVALYDEAPGGGDFDNPNSMRNRPLNDPKNWLSHIYFHSDFNYLEVVQGPTVVTVNHPSVAAIPAPPGATVNSGWASSVADHALLTHGLGYPPIVFVAQGNNIIWPGMPVQVDGIGGMRCATVYVTNTQVRLFETAAVGNSALVATNINYTVIVIKDPPAPSGSILFDFEPITGIVRMGREKFNSLRRYMQVVSGGTPFGISYGGRTIDLKNGAPRSVRPDGTAFDPILSALAIAIARIGLNGTNWGTTFGGSMAYNGSYTGPGSIQVQAP